MWVKKGTELINLGQAARLYLFQNDRYASHGISSIDVVADFGTDRQLVISSFEDLESATKELEQLLKRLNNIAPTAKKPAK